VGLALYGAHRVMNGEAGTSGRRGMRTSGGVDQVVQKVKTWLQDFF
jgi:hypothetical protein